jgi:hypothetical protein
MRWLTLLLLVPSLASNAAAHGGTFRGPNNGVPPGLRESVLRGIPCDCGLVECDTCSAEALRRGEEVRISHAVTEVKRWRDVARCRVEVAFETSRERGAVEAYARIEPGPLFAAVAGSVRNGEESLSADLKPSEEGRRAYLYSRRMFDVDPLLVLRRGPGRLDLRLYPVRKDATATVVLEGYLLVEAAAPHSARLYRTDDRYLAVVPLAADAHLDKAAFRDERGGRSLHFLSQAECRERFGSRIAEEVPFVPALESAVTGRGKRAACDDTALVAIATGSPQPPFVGPDRTIEHPRASLSEPSDPEPPPPAVEAVASIAASGGADR